MPWGTRCHEPALERGPRGVFVGAVSTEDIALESLATGWSALRLCAPERVHQLEQSLLGQGRLTPLLGFRGELIEVIDGFKRLLAARRLGWSSLSVRMLEGSAADAKVAIAQANARSGMDDLEQAWLVRALHREDGLTQPEIGRRLGRHKSWVCRRLALAEQLEVSIEADIRLGLLSATAARELTRLPRCNQRAVTDVVIERALTSRQVAGLVHEVLRSDTDNLGRVLSNVGR